MCSRAIGSARPPRRYRTDATLTGVKSAKLNNEECALARSLQNPVTLSSNDRAIINFISDPLIANGTNTL